MKMATLIISAPGVSISALFSGGLHIYPPSPQLYKGAKSGCMENPKTVLSGLGGGGYDIS